MDYNKYYERYLKLGEEKEVSERPTVSPTPAESITKVQRKEEHGDPSENNNLATVQDIDSLFR